MIKGMYKNHADLFAYVSLYILSLIFLLIMALRLNIPPVIDEVATRASPMYLIGNDWSEALHAMGGYYFKYGGGMVYYPLVALIRDPYVLYRSMLALNAFICSFIPVISFAVLKKHFGAGRRSSWFMSLLTFALPFTSLYTLYARADAMLIVTPWIVTLLLLELVKTSVSKGSGSDKKSAAKRRVVLSVLLVLVSCMSYSFHTRGIVVILAVIFAVLIISVLLRTRIVAVIPSVITLAGALYIDNAIASFFRNALYSQYGTAFSSAESYDFGALSKIFTSEGFKGFVFETIGALFNSLVSSWGLVGLGVVLGVVMVIRFIRKPSEASDPLMAFTVFAVILFLGSFAMSIIYFFPYVHDLLSSSEPSRSDWLVYGRYAACGAGPCVLAGLYLCFTKRERLYNTLKIVTFVLFGCVCAAFLIFVAPKIEGVSAVTRNFISISAFVDLASPGITTAVVPGVTQAFIWAALLAGAVMLITVLVSMIVKKSIALYGAALFLSVISVIITFVDYKNIRSSRDEKLMGYIEPVTDVIRNNGDLKDMMVYVDASARDIKHYQYVLADRVCFGEGTDIVPGKPFVVIAGKKTKEKKIVLPERNDETEYMLKELDDLGSFETAKDRIYICIPLEKIIFMCG